LTTDHDAHLGGDDKDGFLDRYPLRWRFTWVQG
jgi:hypothetical protein